MTCETILRFYSYDGVTNYIKCRTGGLQGDRPSTLSITLKFIALLKSVFKKDGNLDFNIGKTKILVEGPTAQHIFNHAKHFLDNDPDLQEIANDFTLDMFKDEGIEVHGAPVDTETKEFAERWSLKGFYLL